VPRSEVSWIFPTLAVVALVTALRVIALYYSKLDLFVDESQYWLWGQNLDLGYFSKPPLSAWIIRLTTELANSSNAFWVRLPAPLFHAATAIILAIWANGRFGPRAAFWAAASYITLPIVAVGSTVISTDTIMAPFFALGLLFYDQLLADGKRKFAVATALMIGLAIMSKYAGAYFLLLAAVAAVALPSYRISRANLGVIIVVTIAVVSPNIYWNLTHDITTLDHTLDNINWLRSASSGPTLDFGNLAEFFLGQFLVVGPVMFSSLLILLWKFPRDLRGLLLFSTPVIALISVQALLSGAFANWAFAAYLAAVLATIPWLLRNHPKWLWLNITTNGLLTIALPMMIIFTDQLGIGIRNALFQRTTGREYVSNQILDLAAKNSAPAIVASGRGILADLFYTGRNRDLAVYSVRPKGKPRNYYQQVFPYVADDTSPVLFITKRTGLRCNDAVLPELPELETYGTAYQGARLRAYLVPPNCSSLLR